MRLSICVPSTGMCRTQFAYSLAGLVAHFQSARVDGERALTVKMLESSVIHQNRETLVKESIDWGATHIMFLDEDMVFDPRVLDTLYGRRHPIVLTNYPKRGWPITFVARNMKGDIITTTEDSTGIDECSYSGFGASLIAREVFEKVELPWFLPLHINGNYTTEDAPFFERARQAGFTVWVDHDASKMVGHIGLHTFQWRQYGNAS